MILTNVIANHYLYLAADNDNLHKEVHNDSYEKIELHVLKNCPFQLLWHTVNMRVTTEQLNCWLINTEKPKQGLPLEGGRELSPH